MVELSNDDDAAQTLQLNARASTTAPPGHRSAPVPSSGLIIARLAPLPGQRQQQQQRRQQQLTAATLLDECGIVAVALQPFEAEAQAPPSAAGGGPAVELIDLVQRTHRTVPISGGVHAGSSTLALPWHCPSTALALR